MENIIVHALPQTAPISAMRTRQSELLDMVSNGPVMLLSRSKPSAVLISPDYWDAIASALAHWVNKEDSVVKPDVKSHMIENTNSVENIDALAAIAALAQPVGPPDLSLKFDTYSAQVLDD